MSNNEVHRLAKLPTATSLTGLDLVWTVMQRLNNHLVSLIVAAGIAYCTIRARRPGDNLYLQLKMGNVRKDRQSVPSR